MTLRKKTQHDTITRQTMTRRTALGGIGATALAGTLGGSLISIAPGRAADYTVNLQLGWLVSNGILGEVMADHHGYFADEGLELNVIPAGLMLMAWLRWHRGGLIWVLFRLRRL